MNLEKLQAHTIFWSYDASNSKLSEAVVIEQILKFGDTEALVSLFKEISQKEILRVWQLTMQNDLRFVRQNYFLKTFFLSKRNATIAAPTRRKKLEELAAKH
ncbi:MAG: hypothetical protein ACKVOU_12130 [Cytophagales bacterium]